MDLVASPQRASWLKPAWRLLVVACTVTLLALLVPFVELIAIVPVMVAALAGGAAAASRLTRGSASRVTRVVLVVVMPAVLLAIAEVAFAVVLQDSRSAASVWEWVRQILFGVVSVPFWVATAAMAARAAVGPDAARARDLAVIGVESLVVTAALGLGAMMLRL